MDYETYRKGLIELHYESQIADAIARHRPGRPVVVLLPGGLGSQLKRSAHTFPDKTPFDQITETIWMDLGIAARSEGLLLAIDADGKDADQFVVAPDGPFAFLGLTPYDDVEAFVRSKGWNYVTLPYDWRRPLAESVANLRFFLGELDKRIVKLTGKSAISDTLLVAHSMGGLVLTLALRDAAFAAQPYKGFVTFGTPFYGTFGQQERYYVGIDILNSFYLADEVATMAASLPGPYSLMFLPKEIFDGPDRPKDLTRYPIVDATVLAAAADPYSTDPRILERWPKTVRADFIAANKRALMDVAKPIQPQAIGRFVNIRSLLDDTTPVELTWRNVNGTVFTLGDKENNPIRTRTKGPGDGTVPGWSAFHAHADPANQRSLSRASDHARFFEHPEVLAIVGSLVERGRLPAQGTLSRTRLPQQAPQTVASRKAARAELDTAIATIKAGGALGAGLIRPRTARALMHEFLR